ncbi:hypothetical protein Tco_0596199 [Tanacetum coccineum]
MQKESRIEAKKKLKVKERIKRNDREMKTKTTDEIVGLSNLKDEVTKNLSNCYCTKVSTDEQDGNTNDQGDASDEILNEDTKKKSRMRIKMKNSTRKRKLEDDTDKENEELRLCLTIAPDEEKEVDYEILDRKYPIIDWKTQNYGTKPQTDEAKSIAKMIFDQL